MPKTKRVLLLAHPWRIHENAFELQMRVPHAIGLAYLAAVVRRRGHDVKILDCLAEGWNKTEHAEGHYRVGLDADEIKQQIKEYSPDICGISCSFTSQKEMAHLLASLVKEVDPTIVVLMGGAYPSCEYKHVIDDKNVDFVFKGESEKTLEYFLDGKSPEKISGIVFRKGKQVIDTGLPDRYENLDDIPQAAYDLLPMEKYFEAAESGRGSRPGYVKKTVSVITSRGCPYNCIFCSIHAIWGKRWRARSPERVVEELKLLVEDYGVENIEFEDDNLTLDGKRFEKICDGIIKEKLNITWETPNGVRADTITPELAKKMKASGCQRIRFGIENGDQEFLNKTICKGLDLDVAERAMKYLLAEGIPVGCFFIMGIPGESEKTFRNTYKYALKCAKLGAIPYFALANPLPHTKMYRIAEENGYLIGKVTSDDVVRHFEANPFMETDKFSREDVKRWMLKVKRDCLLVQLTHPKFLFNTDFGTSFKNPLYLLRNPQKILGRIKLMVKTLRMK